MNFIQLKPVHQSLCKSLLAVDTPPSQTVAGLIPPALILHQLFWFIHRQVKAGAGLLKNSTGIHHLIPRSNGVPVEQDVAGAMLFPLVVGTDYVLSLFRSCPALNSEGKRRPTPTQS